LKSWSRPQRPIFPPQKPTPTQARTQEVNKGRSESRSICTAALTAEQIGFPLAEQGALLLRQVQGRKDELVSLVTSVEAANLPARKWLQLNRFAWGIENGTHQRLDVSHNDDRCRIRGSNGLWVMGMLRRLSNSLFMEWRSRQRKPEHETTTDFQTVMAEEHRRRAVRTVLTKNPGLG
jgi:predicted transposase YbfD/YdcC